VMSCSEHRQVLVSKFLFCPSQTPCCLVPDILIRMICYRTPICVSFDHILEYICSTSSMFIRILFWISKPIVRTLCFMAIKKNSDRVKNENKAHGILPSRKH
jgi:hypothetical protein